MFLIENSKFTESKASERKCSQIVNDDYAYRSICIYFLEYSEAHLCISW
jgi:hypothetical protein